MAKLGIITRSRSTGYKAFPDAEQWWRSPEYSSLTRMEAVTVIVRARRVREVDFFIAGIPSERCDHVGTRIRY